MRIIAGELKGRTIPAPPGTGTRPTTDALRETIFSTLSHLVDWPSCTVLDLCCGSGAMGFEALSRGAKHATFVDASRVVCKQVEASAKDLGLTNRCTVICSSVERAPLTGPFHVVFADPPYDAMMCNRIATALVAKGLLAPGGLYVAEHSEREALLTDEHWEHLAQKKRGQAVVDIRKLR